MSVLLSHFGEAVETHGRAHYQMMFKAALVAGGTAGYIVDASMSSGTPKYNAYAGPELTATPLIGGGNAGVYAGPFEAGLVKHLVSWNAQMSQAPAWVRLLDYLLCYPLIDGDSTGAQVMVNASGLPRHTTGAGVRAMLVSFAPMTAAATVSYSYTNSEGVAGRTATGAVVPAGLGGVVVSAAVPSNGTAVSTSNVCTPYLPLEGGDTGIRSVESVTFNSSPGGFMTLVLVKPLAQLAVLEAGVTAEHAFGMDSTSFPQVSEGAYLQCIAQIASASASSLVSAFLFANV